MVDFEPFHIKVGLFIELVVNLVNKLVQHISITACSWPIGAFEISYSKGQLISKGYFGVFKSTQTQNGFFKDFCPGL